MRNKSITWILGLSFLLGFVPGAFVFADVARVGSSGTSGSGLVATTSITVTGSNTMTLCRIAETISSSLDSVTANGVPMTRVDYEESSVSRLNLYRSYDDTGATDYVMNRSATSTGGFGIVCSAYNGVAGSGSEQYSNPETYVGTTTSGIVIPANGSVYIVGRVASPDVITIEGSGGTSPVQFGSLINVGQADEINYTGSSPYAFTMGTASSTAEIIAVSYSFSPYTEPATTTTTTASTSTPDQTQQNLFNAFIVFFISFYGVAWLLRKKS